MIEIKDISRVIKGSRKFHCDLFWGRWKEISCGVSFGLDGPNFELHIPFGFFRIGWYGVHGPYKFEELYKPYPKVGMDLEDAN